MRCILATLIQRNLQQKSRQDKETEAFDSSELLHRSLNGVVWTSEMLTRIEAERQIEVRMQFSPSYLTHVTACHCDRFSLTALFFHSLQFQFASSVPWSVNTAPFNSHSKPFLGVSSQLLLSLFFLLSFLQSSDLAAQYAAALAYVTAGGDPSMKKPSQAQQLQFYALFKQEAQGQCKEKQPSRSVDEIQWRRRRAQMLDFSHLLLLPFPV
jgi:hypothetical protein